jgi:hypothetical protein
VTVRKSFNTANNSEPTNITEQIDFSDTTSPELSYTTESGNTWKFEDTTESGNTSILEDTTESKNASKSEEAHRKFRSIDTATDLAGPELTQSTEGKVLIDCKNPETTCVTVNCSLRGTIGNMSKAHVTFSMSATIEDLGEFTCPYGVGRVRPLLTHA